MFVVYEITSLSMEKQVRGAFASDGYLPSNRLKACAQVYFKGVVSSDLEIYLFWYHLFLASEVR